MSRKTPRQRERPFPFVRCSTKKKTVVIELKMDVFKFRVYFVLQLPRDTCIVTNSDSPIHYAISDVIGGNV